MKISSSFSLFRASCRIRTNDPEITNHVLWPTELKRQVGKLFLSHRYNLIPLLCSHPGGIQRELVVRDLPMYLSLSEEKRCKDNKKNNNSDINKR